MQTNGHQYIGKRLFSIRHFIFYMKSFSENNNKNWKIFKRWYSVVISYKIGYNSVDGFALFNSVDGFALF
jgi:hypothetical protein